MRISAPKLGTLANSVTTSRDAPPWEFGTRALMRNLASRGLLNEVNCVTDTLTHLINGEASAATRRGESINPSNLDEVVARYPKGGAAEVE